MSPQQTLMIEPSWKKKWQLNLPRSYADSVLGMVNQGLRSHIAQEIPIWVFVASDGERVSSTVPVSVVIREEGPDEECGTWAYVFSCEKLHVFASGDTYSDAETSFHDQVVHFFREYKNARPEDLDDGAAEVKMLYDTYFHASQN